MLLKNKHIFEHTHKLCFEENLYEVCLEIPFSDNWYHVKVGKLIALQINWPISIWCGFLLKVNSKQVLLQPMLLIAKLYFFYVALIVLTKATKGITLWSIKIFLQNLRYKHKKNIKTPKWKLAYMRFLTAKIQTLE